MLLPSPENFSENGARPVQFLGPQGRLIGWARSFSDFMTVTDNTIVGGRSLERLTRIAGRDVSGTDGHTVGKTFPRKELLGCSRQPSSATIADPTWHHHASAPAAPYSYYRVDLSPPQAYELSCLQNGTGETGLGVMLPGFLRSNELTESPHCRLRPPASSLLPTMPEKNSH